MSGLEIITINILIVIVVIYYFKYIDLKNRHEKETFEDIVERREPEYKKQGRVQCPKCGSHYTEDQHSINPTREFSIWQYLCLKCYHRWGNKSPFESFMSLYDFAKLNGGNVGDLQVYVIPESGIHVITCKGVVVADIQLSLWGRTPEETTKNIHIINLTTIGFPHNWGQFDNQNRMILPCLIKDVNTKLDINDVL